MKASITRALETETAVNNESSGSDSSDDETENEYEHDAFYNLPNGAFLFVNIHYATKQNKQMVSVRSETLHGSIDADAENFIEQCITPHLLEYEKEADGVEWIVASRLCSLLFVYCEMQEYYKVHAVGFYVDLYIPNNATTDVQEAFEMLRALKVVVWHLRDHSHIALHAKLNDSPDWSIPSSVYRLFATICIAWLCQTLLKMITTSATGLT